MTAEAERPNPMAAWTEQSSLPGPHGPATSPAGSDTFYAEALAKLADTGLPHLVGGTRPVRRGGRRPRPRAQGAHAGHTPGGVPVYTCAAPMAKEGGRPYALLTV